MYEASDIEHRTSSVTRFRVEEPVYINIIRDPINRFLSNYFFRRFGDWRGEQNHLIRTPGMKDDERYLVRRSVPLSLSVSLCRS
jgi:hypothetical protein